MTLIPTVAVPLFAAILVTTLGERPQDNPPVQDKNIAMSVTDIEELLERHREGGSRYTGFFRVPSMHAGIYTLPKDGEDNQSPHGEDEIYYVLKGKAKIKADGRTEPVKVGSFVFVAAGEEHTFVDIEEDLELLVVFSTGPRQKNGVEKD